MRRSRLRLAAESIRAARRAGFAARRGTLWLVGSLIGSAAALAQPAVTSTTADTQLSARGNEVFQYWCAPCHAPGPLHPGTQALAVLYGGAKPAALEERTDLTPELTRTFVRTGVSVMPPFRKTEISDADLAALAAYLAP